MLDYCIQTALHMRVKLNWKMEKKIAYIHMNAEKEAHVHDLLLFAGSVRSATMEKDAARNPKRCTQSLQMTQNNQYDIMLFV